MWIKAQSYGNKYDPPKILFGRDNIAGRDMGGEKGTKISDNLPVGEDSKS